MGMLLKLAWRNIFRNKRRTVLSGLAVGIGLASLMFVDALIGGMFESMVRTATDSFIGQGQIHALGFRDSYEVDLTVQGYPATAGSLDGDVASGPLAAWSPRAASFAMLTSASDVRSVMLYGIDPGREPALSLVDEAIIKGSYLPSDGARSILIGYKAAEALGVGPGERVVVTVAQAKTGELSQELFRVGGIFRFGIREVDSSMAYVDIGSAQRMLGIGSAVHEIALRFDDINDAGDRSLPLFAKYSTPGNEALGWNDIMPQLESVLEMSEFSTFLTTMLVFGVVGLTIMNTLFMSLYERMYEFGVLRAIGTRPIHMAVMILLEAASLAVVSMAIGIALGTLVNWIISIYGIDYSGIEFAGVTITEPIYTIFGYRQYTLIPLMIMAFSIVAAMYPAIFAARLIPAKAMKRSM